MPETLKSCPVHPDRQATAALNIPCATEPFLVCPECQAKVKAGDKETIRVCFEAYQAGHRQQITEFKKSELNKARKN